MNDENANLDSEPVVDPTSIPKNDENLTIVSHSNDVQLEYSKLVDSDNACIQDDIHSQTIDMDNIPDDYLINVSDCVGSLNTQDKMDIQHSIANALNEFFVRFNIETPNGLLQIVSELTYGDLVICFLLFLILLVLIMRWFWEVLRY